MQGTSSKVTQEDKDGLCFVIMPFGGYFDVYFKTVYLPAIEEANLKAVRADSLYRSRKSITSIFYGKESGSLTPLSAPGGRLWIVFAATIPRRKGGYFKKMSS